MNKYILPALGGVLLAIALTFFINYPMFEKEEVIEEIKQDVAELKADCPELIMNDPEGMVYSGEKIPWSNIAGYAYQMAVEAGQIEVTN